MPGEKLEAFKIGDLQQAKVPPQPVKAKKDPEAAPPVESQSLGFKRIEAAIDHDDPQEIIANLQTIITSLNELRQGGELANRDKLALEKSLLAVERGVQLLEYLFRVKQELIAGQAETADGQK